MIAAFVIEPYHTCFDVPALHVEQKRVHWTYLCCAKCIKDIYKEESQICCSNRTEKEVYISKIIPNTRLVQGEYDFLAEKRFGKKCSHSVR